MVSGDVSQGCTANDEAAALRTCARVGVAYAQDPQQKDRSAATDFVNVAGLQSSLLVLTSSR